MQQDILTGPERPRPKENRSRPRKQVDWLHTWTALMKLPVNTHTRQGHSKDVSNNVYAVEKVVCYACIYVCVSIERVNLTTTSSTSKQPPYVVATSDQYWTSVSLQLPHGTLFLCTARVARPTLLHRCREYNCHLLQAKKSCRYHRV